MEDVLQAHQWASQLVQDCLDPASRLMFARTSRASMRTVMGYDTRCPYRCSLTLTPASRLDIVDALATQMGMQHIRLRCGDVAVPAALAGRVTRLTISLSDLAANEQHRVPWHAFTQLEELEVRHSWRKAVHDSRTPPELDGVACLGAALQHAAQLGQTLLPKLHTFTYDWFDRRNTGGNGARYEDDDACRMAYQAAVNSVLAQLGPRVPCVRLQLEVRDKLLEELWDDLLDVGLLIGATSLRLRGSCYHAIQETTLATAFRLPRLQQLHIDGHISPGQVHGLLDVLPPPQRLPKLIMDFLYVDSLHLLPLGSIDMLMASYVYVPGWVHEQDAQLLAQHQHICLAPPPVEESYGLGELACATIADEGGMVEACVLLAQRVQGPALWFHSSYDTKVQQVLAALPPTVSCVHLSVRRSCQHLEANARALPAHVQHVVLRQGLWFHHAGDVEKVACMLAAVSTVLQHAPSVRRVTWLLPCSDWVAGTFRHNTRDHGPWARVDLVTQ